MSHRASGMTRACSPDKSPPAAPFPATGGAGGAIRELYGGAEDFLTRDRRLTQAARVEDTPRCRVGFPILSAEPEEFAEIIERLHSIIAGMPSIGGSDQATAHLHYFYAGSD